MNFRFNALLVIAIFMSMPFIHALASSLASSHSVYKINERLQKLKQEYEQIGEQIVKGQNKLDVIMKRNKSDKELPDRLAALVYYFNIIEQLESQKMDELDKLILKDTFSGHSGHVKKRRLETIDTLNDLITRQYNKALFSYFGSYGSATKAIKAKIKIHEDMMAQYEVGRNIKRNVELYKSMISSSRSNQREEGIVSMDNDGESSQVDSQCSMLKTSKTY